MLQISLKQIRQLRFFTGLEGPFQPRHPKMVQMGRSNLPQKGSHSSIWRPLEGHEQTAGSLGSRPTDKKIFSWPTWNSLKAWNSPNSPRISPFLCTKIKHIQSPNAPILKRREITILLWHGVSEGWDHLGVLFSKLTAGLEEAWHHDLKLKAAVCFWLEFSINLTNGLPARALSLF